MSKRVTMNSPTIDVLLAAGVEPTLDEWLVFNEATETFDYELLESLLAEFHDEYIDRVRLHSEYEAKWNERARIVIDAVCDVVSIERDGNTESTALKS